LLEILTQGDEPILELISENPGAMKALLDSYGDSPGMLWEELIIRFEWTFELQRIYDELQLDEDERAVIEEAEKKIRYEFSYQMVKDWSS
jgi:hypothetical protein